METFASLTYLTSAVLFILALFLLKGFLEVPTATKGLSGLVVARLTMMNNCRWKKTRPPYWMPKLLTRRRFVIAFVNV